MNTINAQIPPQLPLAPAVAPDLLPLGANAEERDPISNLVIAVEAVLRQPRRVMLQLRQPDSGRLIGILLFGALVCSLIYGVVVGTFSMGTQLWAAPVKIAGGLLVTAVICLPSLYIFSCVGGSRAGLKELCGLVAGLLLLMSVLLIGFAPVAWLFSQSTESFVWMGVLHLAFWFIATCFGLRFLGQGFSHSQARSKTGLYTWIVLFVLVAIQMTTALRPIVGRADTFLPTEKKFFLRHWGDCLATPPPAPR
jgi:hypothetical protein